MAERDRPPDPLALGKLHRIVAPLLGEAPWEASVGHGSFLTLEFGAPLPPTPQGFVHGEWHLWVYGCAWRLQDAERVIASCEDSREQMERGVSVLEGRPLRSWRVSAPALDTVATFDGGVELLLFPIYTEDVDHWRLWTPGGRVLAAGLGASWSYRPGDEA